MRVASFNVENLFERARALQLDWDDGRAILERYARINQLLNKPLYSDEDKSEIKELLRQLGLARSDVGARYAELLQLCGRLLRRSPRLEIVATRRSSWIGCVELKTGPVNDLALEHTAMVICDVAADVIGVVEAENRIALDRFSAQLLTKVRGQPYEHVMMIDANDERGIDVGVMTRAGYEIVGIRSHVNDTDAQGKVFSRDCPEFTVTTPTGERLIVLVNHFKSKGNGRLSVTNALRKQQATRVAAIYRRLLEEGEEKIAVVGDLNDTQRPTRSDRCSRPGSRTCPSIRASATTVGQARSRTARRPRSSTTSSSPPHCSARSSAARSSAPASGAARTAPSGRSTAP